MTFVRIKPPRNKNQKMQRSINTGGVKVVVGGEGIDVKDAGTVKRIKAIGGSNIETSAKPFNVAKPKGGIMNMSSAKMEKAPPAEAPAKGKEKY